MTREMAAGRLIAQRLRMSATLYVSDTNADTNEAERGRTPRHPPESMTTRYEPTA